MKLRELVVIILGMGVLATCPGCGNEGSTGNDEDQLPNEIVATWTFQSVTYDGISLRLSDAFSWEAESVACQIIVKADRTYEYREIGGDSSVVFLTSGTFSVSGNRFTITPPIGPYISGGTWQVEKSTLTLTISAANHTAVIIATK